MIPLAASLVLALGASSAQEPSKLALVVGCSRYDQFPLEFATEEARLLGKCLLERGGYRVFRWGDDVSDPGGRPREGADLLGWVRRRLGPRPWDQVLFYYCGHGVLDDGRAYLALDDPLSREPGGEVPATWVEVAQIGQLVGLQGSSAFFAIDSCHSGGGIQGKSPFMRRIKEHASPFSYRHASCHGSQSSFAVPWRELEPHLSFESKYLDPETKLRVHDGDLTYADRKHSVFSFFFRRGLIGAADGLKVVEGLPPDPPAAEGDATYELRAVAGDYGVDFLELTSYVRVGMRELYRGTLRPQLPWSASEGEGGTLEIIPLAEKDLARGISASLAYLRGTLGHGKITYRITAEDIYQHADWTSRTFARLAQALNEVVPRDAGIFQVFLDESLSRSIVRVKAKRDGELFCEFVRNGVEFIRLQ